MSARFTLCACAAIALWTADASAQPRAPSRVFGLGSTLGFGADSNTVTRAFYPIGVPPTLEARIPFTPRWELSLWVPVTTLVLVGALNGRSMLWLDAFATWYPTRDAGGFFVAPGLGVLWGADQTSSGVALRVPARIGYQVSNEARSFGFDVALRPWVDVVFPSANVDVAARYGAVIELGFLGYVTRPSR
jgi:hypothetical protein